MPGLARYITIATSYIFYTGAQNVIFSGAGFGTYYYDIKQVNVCGTSFTFQNAGPIQCSWAKALSLTDLNSNYVVAMNRTQLAEDLTAFCGKRVIVSVNGEPSDLPLFIGDGCERCSYGSGSNAVWDPHGAPGLDFSLSALSELSASAWDKGHVPITWEIVDEVIHPIDIYGSGAPQPTSTSALALPTKPFQNTNLESKPTPVNPNSAGLTCATGRWRCKGRKMEQCLSGRWASRATCAEGTTCQGGANPYCTPGDLF
ncbi:hypothetical protein BDV35DRAFT_398725 [Aspergillus flavus]|uniref:Uncharacterized protein n=1 Tax=Aspergillus flavus TaxID=5059 RepID=A0A5N6GG39_ASPFL|nr:hypothetical protein BDV35DRAFT_398725 [Aspergillus flavus]GMG10247.1 unnamed protein product [Aspergillus oryzae]